MFQWLLRIFRKKWWEEEEVRVISKIQQFSGVSGHVESF